MATTVAENPLFEELFLGYVEVVPLVFSGLMALSLFLVVLAPFLCDLIFDGPDTITEMYNNISVVIKATRSFLDRACSRDGVRHARQSISRCLAAVTHQTGLYHLYLLLRPSDEVIAAATILVSDTSYSNGTRFNKYANAICSSLVPATALCQLHQHRSSCDRLLDRAYRCLYRFPGGA